MGKNVHRKTENRANFSMNLTTIFVQNQFKMQGLVWLKFKKRVKIENVRRNPIIGKALLTE